MIVGRQVAIQKLFADIELNRRGKAKAGRRGASSFQRGWGISQGIAVIQAAGREDDKG